jgi:predicted GIY-YIG superfamily endonuclease
MGKIEISWTYYDDEPPGKALPLLKKFIDRRQNVNPDQLNYWYVGQALDPEARLRQHQADCDQRKDSRWTDAYVIYGAQDIGSVTQVENGLIDYLQRRAARRGEQGRLLNVAGARCAGDQQYHVYVLVDDHPRSSSGAKRQRAAEKPNWDHCYRQQAEAAGEAQRNRSVIQRFERAVLAEDGGRARAVRYCYIGFTNDPRRRYREHQALMMKHFGGNVWEEMRVIYQTSCYQAALDAEAAVIAHAHTRGDLTVHNTLAGSRGAQNRAEHFPYYYVYYLEDRA